MLIAAIPALGLLALYTWSDGQIDDADPVPPPPSTLVAPAPPPDPLATSMMSYRRMPTVLSRDLNVEQFRQDLVPFLATVDERSCAAVSVDGEPVGAKNDALSVLPASSLKVVVAAVALEELGADWRFTTTVSSSGPPVGGLIAGDVVIVGGGDPLLTSDWYPTSNLERRPVFNGTSFDALADAVVAQGVTRISGSVLGDGSRYDDEFFAPGWGVGVAGADAGPYDALMANDARVLGEDLRANDPNAGAAREFARLLVERGVRIDGEATTGSVDVLGPEPTELASIDSAPLSEVLEEMLVNSDNNTAELLTKEIGLQRDPSTVGSREAGTAAMLATLRQWGVDTTGVVIEDGSGLGLGNRLTCAALLDVLQYGDVDDPVGSGLPVAGRTGALSDVFLGHPLEGVLRGKTGTLNNPPFNEDPPAVKALAGYVPVDGGGAIEYVLVLNGPTISDQSEYRPVWNDLADSLATYPSGPTPADLGVVT